MIGYNRPTALLVILICRVFPRLVEFFCRVGLHTWVDCTIKWLSGGPYMEWSMCDHCSILLPTVNQDKWEPFTVEKDSTRLESPQPAR